MKVLVATKERQGERKNDFGWADEGELVRFADECDGEQVDGKCGCRRAMVGMVSGKTTTTFMVVDRPETPETIEKAIREWYKASGWGKLFNEPGELDKMVKDDLRELLRLAQVFPVGKVIEKRGSTLQLRREVETIGAAKANLRPGMVCNLHLQNPTARGIIEGWQDAEVAITRILKFNVVVKRTSDGKIARVPASSLQPK